MRNRTGKCPRCNKIIVGYPAISRVDNKTEICSNCGIVEALQIFIIADVKEVKGNVKYNKRTSRKHKCKMF